MRTQPGRTWPEDDFAAEADFSTIDIDLSKLMLINLAGDTASSRLVLIDSALGRQARNTPFFHQRMKDLEQWPRELPLPKGVASSPVQGWPRRGRPPAALAAAVLIHPNGVKTAKLPKLAV